MIGNLALTSLIFAAGRHGFKPLPTLNSTLRLYRSWLLALKAGSLGALGLATGRQHIGIV